MIFMTLDSRDKTLLRLTGKYRWLPFDKLGGFGISGLTETAELLSITGLLIISRDKRYVRLSRQGYELLKTYGFDYGPGSARAYSSEAALRRRLAVAGIMLTALRAGIDVCHDNIEALGKQPVFCPAFDLRSGGINLMNAASCAGFGHWGGRAYMLQYIGRGSPGMYLTNELTHLHNLSSVFDRRLNTPASMIFAGASYRAVHEQLQSTSRSKRNDKHGFADYSEVYRKSDMPIHLLSCDETGAMQLALMSRPDYNSQIARAAFGDIWTPRDDQIPDADGSVDGNPLIIAADMDIRRVERVCGAARSLGRSEVMLAALPEQIEGFLLGAFPPDGMITHLYIEKPVLDDAFPGGISLYSMAKSGGISEGGSEHG